MRSGNRLGLLGHTNGADSSSVESLRVWLAVWNTDGPPKLRHFLWRAYKDSLATKYGLYQRYCVPSPLCYRCSNDPKTILNAILDCPKVQPIWAIHPNLSLLQDAPRSPFAYFIMWVFGHASNDNLDSILATVWDAWFFRNKQIFVGHDGDPVSVARRFNNMVHDYKRYNTIAVVPQQPTFLRKQSWRPPLDGWVKVNFDAYVADNAIRGLGVVVRDSSGKLLIAGVRRIKA